LEAVVPYEEEIPLYGDLAQPSEEINALAHRVIGIAIAVHRELGPRLPEGAYERALAIEFDEQGIGYASQHRLEVRYKGIVVAIVRLDFLIESKLVLEVKSIEAVTAIDRKQVLRYLELTKLPLGLLINFNVFVLKEGIRRVFRKEDPR
jgi:GxxExxY protein